MRLSNPNALTRPSYRRGLAHAALVALLAGATFGCGGGGGGGPVVPARIGMVPVEARLYEDDAGTFPDSVRQAIVDGATFEDVWNRLTSDQASPPPRPAVNFGDNMVLLVAAGRMSPGDRIRVDSVGVRSRATMAGGEEDVLTVVVSTIRECLGLQGAAYPVQLVRVPRFDGPVTWIDQPARQCTSGLAVVLGESVDTGDPPRPASTDGDGG